MELPSSTGRLCSAWPGPAVIVALPSSSEATCVPQPLCGKAPPLECHILKLREVSGITTCLNSLPCRTLVCSFIEFPQTQKTWVLKNISSRPNFQQLPVLIPLVTSVATPPGAGLHSAAESARPWGQTATLPVLLRILMESHSFHSLLDFRGSSTTVPHLFGLNNGPGGFLV